MKCSSFETDTKHLAETGEILVAETDKTKTIGKLSGKPPKFFAVNRTFDDQMLFMQALKAASGPYGNPDEVWDKVAQSALDDCRISEKVELEQAKKNSSFLLHELMDALGENERLSQELSAARKKGA